MAYVITDKCLGERYAVCATVCPVECIHPGDYYGPSGLALPYATLTPRAETPVPPPSTGGDTTPPPPADPCADVKAELAAANARADQAVLDAREANAALDTANGLLDAARGMIDAGRDLLAATREDLDKIRGSAKTIATRGKVIPADVGRATGIQTAAERAIAAIDKATAAT